MPDNPKLNGQDKDEQRTRDKKKVKKKLGWKNPA